jgi:hypothetical protein
MYDVEIPEFTRALSIGDVICRVSAPADAILLVLEAWFGMTGSDDLNEPNSIQMVRLSTDGSAGATLLFEARETGDPATGATGAGMDTGGWTLPTVSDALGGATPFNLATGWNWSWTQSAPIVVSPSARIGFRISDAPSASMDFSGGLTILEIGG